MMYKYLILLLGCLILGGAKCGEKTKTGKCSTLGTVKDFTGLDGCQYLIVLDNQEKLQPVNTDDLEVEWEDGQRIRFNFEEVLDQMSICMAGKMVEITCIEILDDSPASPPQTGGVKPIKIPCIETLDPFSTEWMEITMNKTNAYQVVRYNYLTDGFAYFFMGPQQNMLFDCQGTLICECPAKETRCDDQTKPLSGELVMWERD